MRGGLLFRQAASRPLRAAPERWKHEVGERERQQTLRGADENLVQLLKQRQRSAHLPTAGQQDRTHTRTLPSAHRKNLSPAEPLGLSRSVCTDLDTHAQAQTPDLINPIYVAQFAPKYPNK